ncbi:LuxR family transcriptional regulator, partial [Rhodococcus sp. CC-R104]|nr:LuxR family transcriptional regulator [Rhodococcus sp. CC-R104]
MFPTTARPPLPVPQEVDRALGSTGLPRLLLVGGAGTGKSALLAAIRQSAVTEHPGLRVIDDAHTLGADDVRDLVDEVHCGTTPLIVATEPRPQRADLRALLSAFATHATLVELRPWSAREIASRATTFDTTLRPDRIRAVHRLTAGIPELVEVALTALQSGDDPKPLVAERIRNRFCVDPELAATLAVVDFGIVADATELTAVLHVGPRRALELVDA